MITTVIYQLAKKYFRDFRRCKYLDYCRYKHEKPVNDTTIKQIETKCEELEKMIIEKEKEKELKKIIEFLALAMRK